ncbi:MAG: ABC transporter substrate-binding protein [Actinomycetota bacterium]|nr:ABC transporter substrate-binding protein [Actinomycetota bacterium]
MRKDAVRVTVVLLFLASACTSGGDERHGSPNADTASLQGGTLRMAVGDFALLQELDPQRAYSQMAWELMRCCLLRTLYSYNGTSTEEGGAELRPDLAAGPPEVSPDGLTWTFRLQEGLRYAPPFQDTSITALDLVRGLERTARVTSPQVGYPYFYEGVISGFEDYGSGAADSIGGLETPDERTLVVRLDRVTSDLAYRFSLPATAPIPEGAAEGHDADYARFLVASGPYMIEGSERLDPSVPPKEQEPASGFRPAVHGAGGTVEQPGSLTLVRNPSWDPSIDDLRPAYADRMELSLGGGAEELARRVDTAELDLVFGLGSPFEQIARYRADPTLQDQVFVNPDDVAWAVTMNLAVAPFDDVHVRRAVSLAIDKGALVDLLFESPYGPFGGHVGEVATHIAPDALEGGLLRAFDPYPYDPAAAQAEMRASAYDRTGDGKCDAPACRNIQTIVIDEAVIPAQARVIRDNLAEVGIDLTLQTRPIERFFSTIHDPRQQVPIEIAYPWGKDYPDGAGWFQGLFNASAIPGSNTSLLGATPQQLREWGYSVTSVPSGQERLQVCLERRGVARTECWAELDQYLMTEVVPRVPYMSMSHSQVVSERVVSYSFDQFAGLPALDRIALAPGSE